jgi:hypothetical protein
MFQRELNQQKSVMIKSSQLRTRQNDEDLDTTSCEGWTRDLLYLDEKKMTWWMAGMYGVWGLLLAIEPNFFFGRYSWFAMWTFEPDFLMLLLLRVFGVCLFSMTTSPFWPMVTDHEKNLEKVEKGIGIPMRAQGLDMGAKKAENVRMHYMMTMSNLYLPLNLLMLKVGWLVSDNNPDDTSCHTGLHGQVCGRYGPGPNSQMPINLWALIAYIQMMNITMNIYVSTDWIGRILALIYHGMCKRI